MSRELGGTAKALLENYQQYSTGKDAAIALKVSPVRIYILSRKLGITKWNRKFPRKATLVTLECTNCGKLFERRKSSVNKTKTGAHFCSKECQGRLLGKQYGFGSRQ
jgi:hypothetical protein